ncbi:cytidylate kinase [Enterococcus asini ATCC 700915]|uniref:Cytidylate kinase n=1 Tax=Enterococcus asini ATCC 700915 TaxID=1158606 RepID=R2S8E5_9ENTE|nr:(d)CMP kinase [Enterococcus asini]EOH89111.1 cytidylate kinase [Enterococcus asini ATCC 700915]EOT55682.1 cytidylate kinase [Enterococcus asini ATCC 700915]MDT2764796.1 (d)CMP kinase [Enterococcus asini]OJG12961.1 cytidylate kinase [Enterococcus asini]
MRKINIAIDGPASSGKSTVAKIIAKDLGYIYTDTGAMYRSITYLAVKHQVAFDDEAGLVALIEKYPITFSQTTGGQAVFCDGEEVTQAIRNNEVTHNVSEVSAHEEVRKRLVAQQQKIAEAGGVVMDGRDIGTQVLPNAEVKIFLVASVDERAERRYKENIAKGIATDLATLKEEIKQRDYLDSHREVSPLKQAADATLIDTTGMSIQDVVAAIETIVAATLEDDSARKAEKEA